MSKQTPDNAWHIDDFGEPDYLDGIRARYMVYQGEGRKPIAYAFDACDARMIAAAHDLLDVAIKALVSMTSAGVVRDGDVHAGDPTIPLLRAAISKATGEAP